MTGPGAQASLAGKWRLAHLLRRPTLAGHGSGGVPASRPSEHHGQQVSSCWVWIWRLQPSSRSRRARAGPGAERSHSWTKAWMPRVDLWTASIMGPREPSEWKRGSLLRGAAAVRAGPGAWSRQIRASADSAVPWSEILSSWAAAHSIQATWWPPVCGAHARARSRPAPDDGWRADRRWRTRRPAAAHRAQRGWSLELLLTATWRICVVRVAPAARMMPRDAGWAGSGAPGRTPQRPGTESRRSGPGDWARPSRSQWRRAHQRLINSRRAASAEASTPQRSAVSVAKRITQGVDVSL